MRSFIRGAILFLLPIVATAGLVFGLFFLTKAMAENDHNAYSASSQGIVVDFEEVVFGTFSPLKKRECPVIEYLRDGNQERFAECGVSGTSLGDNYKVVYSPNGGEAVLASVSLLGLPLGYAVSLGVSILSLILGAFCLWFCFRFELYRNALFWFSFLITVLACYFLLALWNMNNEYWFINSLWLPQYRIF